ncbi:Pr6Pr family membrane protein [Agromyces agglutinans]|uniref:Pr6Pr family membrane protein n=1 Tax=Agromyces agglutinans TaxID=2662258 RepID=UPI0015624C4A|nr:Pr6Pr family membrane protein [Agromyces agglutinans]
MSIPFRYAALVYRVVSVILIAIGLARVLGLVRGTPVWGALTFYTTLSNVLCLVWMLVLVVATIRDLRVEGPRGLSTPSPRFGGAVMEAITVTMLIYLVVLVPSAFVQAGDYEPFTLTDNLIHIITPCLLIGDWLLFSPKGRFRWVDPLLWALIPYAYLVYAFTWSALGGTFGNVGRYPYPFMNVDELGIGGVAWQIVVLTVALVAVGYVYVVLDRLLARAAAKRARAADAPTQDASIPDAEATTAAAPRPGASAPRPR